jgi:hypothetical protein
MLFWWFLDILRILKLIFIFLLEVAQDRTVESNVLSVSASPDLLSEEAKLQGFSLLETGERLCLQGEGACSPHECCQVWSQNTNCTSQYIFKILL